MFREMRRKQQALDYTECLRILNARENGVMALSGDDGYPYAVPLNHVLADGKLYFHCATEGHKIDAIRRCDKVSYCVCDQGYRKEGDWALTFQSVVVFGRAKILEDQEKAIEITRRLSYQFTDDASFIEQEIRQSGANVLVFSLTPEHITGKLVHEA